MNEKTPFTASACYALVSIGLALVALAGISRFGLSESFSWAAGAGLAFAASFALCRPRRSDRP